ncbi:MAG: hypothetical protein V1735_07405 [Nanoarchaeota archaeon]
MFGLENYGITLLYPERLWLIPLALFILFFLTVRTFVPLTESNQKRLPIARRNRRVARLFMFLSRAIIITALILALASPSLEVTHKETGQPGLTILVDRSRSMQVFDLSLAEGLNKRLSESLAASIVDIGKGTQGAPGSDILAHLGENRNLLLITDGYTPYGADFADVMTYAAAMNTTVSAVWLDPIRDESAISVEGPSKVIAGVETAYQVRIDRTRAEPVRVKVSVDGESVIDQDTEGTELNFKRTFTSGVAKIEARVVTEDLFADNNVFRKTVRVYEKPKIFLLGGPSPLSDTLNQLYDVTSGAAMPEDFSPYYTVVIDENQQADIGDLDTYLEDGNGLVVFGGPNSFEFANAGRLSSLLPVIPGKGDLKQKPDLNAVIIVDVSSSQERAVAKAYAVDLLDQFKQNDNVAVVAFAQEAFVVSQLSRMFQKDVPALKGEIAKLGYRCTVDNRYVCSRFDVGFDLAVKQLAGAQGRKYVFLLSDQMFGPTNREPSWALTDMLRKSNVQVIPIITIPVTQEDISKFKSIDNLVLYRSGYTFAKTIAQRTSMDEYGGTVIKPTSSALPQVAIITGKRQEQANAGGQDKTLFVFDSSHFITRNLELTAKLDGANQVVPKSNGKLLVSTADGLPIAVVGYYGLGRVAVMATDDGRSWSHELFRDEKNAELISRTVNWAIGDPERKKDSYVLIPDGRVDAKLPITVKSKAVPSVPGIVFEKSGDIYTGSFTPREAGFQELLSQQFAVNYDAEVAYLGMRQDLAELVGKTQGKIFKGDAPGEITSFVQEKANRLVKERMVLRWPLVAVALGLLLIEIIIRRILEYKNG